MKKMMSARRSLRAGARRNRAMLALEALETKLLPANIIVVTNDPNAFGDGYTPVSSMTSPAGWANPSDHGDYTVSPTVLEDAASAIAMYANDKILIDASVTGVTQSLSATSYGYISVNDDLSTTSGNAITLAGNNQDTEGTNFFNGVTVTGATVTSGGDLTVTGDGYTSNEAAPAFGVYLDDATLQATGTSTVTVTGGTVYSDFGQSVGVLVGGGSSILSAGGSLTVSGTATGTAGDAGELRRVRRRRHDRVERPARLT